jgi:hypothetical protein
VGEGDVQEQLRQSYVLIACAVLDPSSAVLATRPIPTEEENVKLQVTLSYQGTTKNTVRYASTTASGVPVLYIQKTALTGGNGYPPEITLTVESA